jgi:hypothetical protein
LRGDRVRPGDVIGRLSRAGAHCGERRPCLHWGLLRGSTYPSPAGPARERTDPTASATRQPAWCLEWSRSRNARSQPRTTPREIA